ncbi:MAG: membrane protein [Nitrospirales bacterium]|nr:MAG: membrane protein [Nitrospirales bacterium]
MRPTTAVTATNRKRFRDHHLLHGLLAWYVVVWVFLAIDPVDRHDWFLENILAIGLVMVLVVTYRRFPLSDLSYVFLTVFMTLHAIGAHYTYSKVPLGFWMQEWWGLERNHFDRIAHFSFGLFLAYPLRELFLRRVGVRGFWAYYLPVSGILALSGFFEIIESWVALLVRPELGEAYLGTQGDEWDAQKDMTVAVLGACITIMLTYALSKLGSKKSLPDSP